MMTHQDQKTIVKNVQYFHNFFQNFFLLRFTRPNASALISPFAKGMHRPVFNRSHFIPITTE
jgi:hypothetical protein